MFLCAMQNYCDRHQATILKKWYFSHTVPYKKRFFENLRKNYTNYLQIKKMVCNFVV